ncbi:hypothetical protein D3C81_1565110 [compost metagenome]
MQLRQTGPQEHLDAVHQDCRIRQRADGGDGLAPGLGPVVVEDRGNQRVDGREVLVDRADRHACMLGQAIHGQRRPPFPFQDFPAGDLQRVDQGDRACLPGEFALPGRQGDLQEAVARGGAGFLARLYAGRMLVAFRHRHSGMNQATPPIAIVCGVPGTNDGIEVPSQAPPLVWRGRPTLRCHGCRYLGAAMAVAISAYRRYAAPPG